MKHRNIYAVGVALVGLFLFMMVGIAGTMTFSNDSGAVATGIKVEFSANATITWHSGEFSAQDPSGFGKEFTFSGGEVKPGETFTISWGPSVAAVVSHEWEVAASATSTAPTTTPTPAETPPTTAAPAAQPTAPLNTNWDAITLTDLDGNAVIYDDDGIRINFPPGFDMSVVGKIEWYRNGTYLPWLDGKTEITNAEMKTFRGDEKAWSGYGWHRKLVQASPPSSHTDHAIAGYIYGAAIFPKGWDGSFNWVAAKEALTTTVESTFKWHPKEVWAQINQTWLESMEHLSFDEIVAYFQILKEGGFTGISLDMNYYMMTPYDNNPFELKTRDPTISIWNMRTPSQAELEEILKAISEAGLDARIISMIYVSQSYKDAHKDRYIGKGMIDPKNPKLFFENYTHLLEKIIPLLNKYNVKSLVVLDETGNLNTSYPAYIEEMLTKLSTEFNGKLGIDVGANTILEGIYWDNKKRTWKGTIGQMTFLGWKSPDGKKLEDLYSCWTPPLETQKDQRVSVMTPNFVKFWKPLFDYVSSTYSNPPQGFGEIGTYDADGVALGPSYWNMTNKVFDEQEFADVWYSYLKGSKELNVDTINVWIFPLGELYGNPDPNFGNLLIGFKRDENPAYRIIKAIIGPN